MAAPVSAFSAGLQFSRKDVSRTFAGDTTAAGASRSNADGDDAATEKNGCSPVSEEEHLLQKADHLRRTLSDELFPKVDAFEERVRRGRRELAKLQRLLPCDAFFSFRERCAAWRRELASFEELLVLDLLNEAIQRAVEAEEITEAFRWRKSNQWPALTTLLDLELRLISRKRDAEPRLDSTMDTVPASGGSRSSTEAIYKHLAVVWLEAQKSSLTEHALERFYFLRDILDGWSTEWFPRASCFAPDEADSDAVPACGLANTNTCPGTSWNELSEDAKVTSCNSVCPQHLSVSVVADLERSVETIFADLRRLLSK